MAFGTEAKTAQFGVNSIDATKSLAVPAAVNEIDSEIGRLDLLVSDLIPRIAPLLGPIPSGTDKGQAAPSICEFASQLQGRASSLRVINDRLQAVLQSLEF